MLGRRPARDRFRQPGWARNYGTGCARRAGLARPPGARGRGHQGSEGRRRPRAARVSDRAAILGAAGAAPHAPRHGSASIRCPAGQSTPQTTKLQSSGAANCKFVACGEHRLDVAGSGWLVGWCPGLRASPHVMRLLFRSRFDCKFAAMGDRTRRVGSREGVEDTRSGRPARPVVHRL
jgi:hypothetical protein